MDSLCWTLQKADSSRGVKTIITGDRGTRRSWEKTEDCPIDSTPPENGLSSQTCSVSLEVWLGVWVGGWWWRWGGGGVGTSSQIPPSKLEQQI